MKSIKLYLLPFFLITFFSSVTFSQNDFYNDKKAPNEKVLNIIEMDSIIANEYYTEKDFNEIHRINEPQKNNDQEFYYEDEVYHEEDRKARRRDSFLGEVAAEVVVEVVVNTLFILATFWQ